jgi:hypothetical protein
MYRRMGAYENNKTSFNWRMRRLVEHGFLERHYVPETSKKYVYRVGEPNGTHMTERICCARMLSLAEKRSS